ncbi:hypothetical protein KP509_18G040000 [Ceratopteris richardii]|uniref:Uncharacterized protein n=1 Tax=Ceratopteris richardii TaxID=49495 RepID=A0A8T2SSN4_CERRI|nr:hypothetical protein KP509_18G040000 [Ceratopteris richardii]
MSTTLNTARDARPTPAFRVAAPTHPSSPLTAALADSPCGGRPRRLRKPSSWRYSTEEYELDEFSYSSWSTTSVRSSEFNGLEKYCLRKNTFALSPREPSPIHDEEGKSKGIDDQIRCEKRDEDMRLCENDGDDRHHYSDASSAGGGTSEAQHGEKYFEPHQREMSPSELYFCPICSIANAMADEDKSNR